MAAGLSPIEEMEAQICSLVLLSEYLDNKRKWAEKRLKTEKLEIGEGLTLKLHVANTKKQYVAVDRELAARRREYTDAKYRTAPRSLRARTHSLVGPLFEERAEVEARSDTEDPEPLPLFWLGACGTRYYPAAGICVGPASKSNRSSPAHPLDLPDRELARLRRALGLD